MARASTVDVTLERVDPSKPWEHPDSLDPQLELVAPDGFVYQNLVSFDNQPSVDLNASLHEAVLPLTGLYFIGSVPDCMSRSVSRFAA